MNIKKTVAVFAAAAALAAFSAVSYAEGNVAEVDGERYATLQEAVNAADSGDTVKLIADLTGDKTLTSAVTIDPDDNITLDLNRHMIENDPKEEGRTFNVHGTMIVTGNGTIESESMGVFDVKDGGSLTIESGTYNAVGYRRGDKNGATIVIWAGGNVTIKDGVDVFCEKSAALYCLGDAVLNKCKLVSESHSGVQDQYGRYIWQYCVRIQGTAELNGPTIRGIQGALTTTSGGKTIINDGVFETYETTESKGRSYYPCYAANNAEVTINNGKFTAESRQALLVGDEDNGLGGASVIINGGTFKSNGAGKEAVTVKANIVGNLEINGGSYSTDVSQYLAPDTAGGWGADEIMYNVISSKNKATKTGTYRTADEGGYYDQMELFEVPQVPGNVTYNVSDGTYDKDFTYEYVNIDGITKLGLIVTDIPSAKTVTVKLGGQNNE